MRYKFIFIPSVAIAAVAAGLYFFPNYPLPPCHSFVGEMRSGQEVTTFNFTVESKEIALETSFNEPLRALGMPELIRYRFSILGASDENNTWVYQLKEKQSGFVQELKIEQTPDGYFFNWANDRSNNIKYTCMAGKNAEL